MRDGGKISILLFVRNTGSRVEQCGPKTDSMQIRRRIASGRGRQRSKGLLDNFHPRGTEEYFLRQLYWRPNSFHGNADLFGIASGYFQESAFSFFSYFPPSNERIDRTSVSPAELSSWRPTDRAIGFFRVEVTRGDVEGENKRGIFVR